MFKQKNATCKKCVQLIVLQSRYYFGILIIEISEDNN